MMMRYFHICDVILYWFSTLESFIGQLSGISKIWYRLWFIIFILHPLHHMYQCFLHTYVAMCLFHVVIALYVQKSLKNEYIMHFLCLPIFADILPIFSLILPIRYFLDPRRYFLDTDINNADINHKDPDFPTRLKN